MMSLGAAGAPTAQQEPRAPTYEATMAAVGKNSVAGAALYAANATILFVTSGIAVEGIEAIKRWLRESAEANETIESERILSIKSTPDTVVQESILTLVHTSPIKWLLPGVKPTRKRIVVSLVTIASLVNGQVLSKRVYWDQATVLKQLGILPTSLYCKATSSELTLPVLNGRAADGLADLFDSRVMQDFGAPQDSADPGSIDSALTPAAEPAPRPVVQEKVAGLSSRAANDPFTTRGSSAAPHGRAPNNVFPSSEPNGDAFRPSTRVFAKSATSVIRGSEEAPPLRTSVPIDPRRFDNALNLFDRAESTESLPRATNGRRDPNARSTEDVFQPGSSSAKHHRRVYAQANNSSQVSFGDSGTPAEPARASGRGHSLADLPDAAPSAGGGSNSNLGHKHFSYSQINMGGEPQEAQAYRSSSRVLQTPGGKSSITIG